MCVGVPAQVVELLPDATRQAVVDVSGVRRNVDISLIVDEDCVGLGVGDWVLLHVGFAMAVIDEDEARRTMELLILLGGENEDFDDELAMFRAPLPGRAPCSRSERILRWIRHTTQHPTHHRRCPVRQSNWRRRFEPERRCGAWRRDSTTMPGISPWSSSTHRRWELVLCRPSPSPRASMRR